VAASALPPIARVAHRRVVLAGDGPRAFADAVRQALAVGPAPGDERLRFLADNAWRRRHEPLLRLALAA
jgi:hypothetical protein